RVYRVMGNWCLHQTVDGDFVQVSVGDDSIGDREYAGRPVASQSPGERLDDRATGEGVVDGRVHIRVDVRGPDLGVDLLDLHHGLVVDPLVEAAVERDLSLEAGWLRERQVPCDLE